MNTKSRIQIIAENMEQRKRVLDDLKSLIENYDLTNSIIVYEQQIGTFKFLKSGFIQYSKKNIDINEAFSEIDLNLKEQKKAIIFSKNNIPSIVNISHNKNDFNINNGPIYEIIM